MTGPGWPSERQWVTMGLFTLVVIMLRMADNNPELWDVDTFKTVFQAIVLTGLLNMVLAFHFTANKSDEAKSENTHAAFKAIEATANAAGTAPPPDVVLRPGETAQAEDKP